jgi:hypothetical protein
MGSGFGSKALKPAKTQSPFARRGLSSSCYPCAVQLDERRMTTRLLVEQEVGPVGWLGMRIRIGGPLRGSPPFGTFAAHFIV